MEVSGGAFGPQTGVAARAEAPFTFHDTAPVEASLCEEVISGLSRRPRRLSPKLFYDGTGAELFERICLTPEYYVTRTERAILRRYGEEIAALLGPELLLIEPGAGSCGKVRLLLDVLRPSCYAPIDICRDQLLTEAGRLAEEYPWLGIAATCADLTACDAIAFAPHAGRRAIFFPGSTIGNFEPAAAVALLRDMAALAGPGGALLIGVDRKKEKARLDAAYNDAAGITAAFNLNLLTRLNRELDATFDTERFQHHAFYNEMLGRVEMHLIASQSHQVRVADQWFHFAEGEGIHTECSYKYTEAEFATLAGRAGWRVERSFSDDEALFTVYLLGLTPQFEFGDWE